MGLRKESSRWMEQYVRRSGGGNELRVFPGGCCGWSFMSLGKRWHGMMSEQKAVARMWWATPTVARHQGCFPCEWEVF